MSRRTIMSLAATAIIGIGFIGLFLPRRPHTIAVVSIAAVSIGVVFTVVATTVVYAREWRWASVLLQLVPPRSVLLPPGAYYGPGYYGAPAPVGCPYGYYYYAPYNRCVPAP